MGYQRLPAIPAMRPFAVSAPPNNTRQLRSRWAEVILHLTLCSLVVGVCQLWPTPVALIAGGVTYLVGYSYMARREAKNSRILFTPLSFYLIWSLTYLGIAPIDMGYLELTGAPVRFGPVVLSAVQVIDGYQIFLVGWLALHVGIQMLRPYEQLNRAYSMSYGQLWVLWCAGIVYALQHAWFNSRLGNLTGTLQWAPLAALSMFCIIAPGNKRISRHTFWTILLLGTMSLLVMDVLTGSKTLVMMSFLPLILYLLIYVRRRSTAGVAVALSIAIIYFGVVSPVVAAAREQGVVSGAGLWNEFISAIALESATGSPDFSDRLDEFCLRQFEPLPVGFIVGEVNRAGFLNGQSMAYAYYSLIPRFLWPSKPTVTRGAWFSVYLGLAPQENAATTSTGITAIGELYWNYSWPGVVAGMFIIGVLLGALWRLAGPDPLESSITWLLYMATGFEILSLEGEAVSVPVWAIANLLLFSVILWIVRKPTIMQIPFRRYATPTTPNDYLPSA